MGICLDLASPSRGRKPAAFTCSLSGHAPCLLAGGACIKNNNNGCVQGEKSEASRVIFLGWPGQTEMEDEESPHTPTCEQRDASHDGMQLPLYNKTAPIAAQPPLALQEDRVRAQNGRQLGCAHVLASAACAMLALSEGSLEAARKLPIPLQPPGV